MMKAANTDTTHHFCRHDELGERQGAGDEADGPNAALHDRVRERCHPESSIELLA